MTVERDAGRDPRRGVPRTDAVLRAPELEAAIRRLGHARVKESVVAAQSRARLGHLTPSQEAVVAAVLADLPVTAASLRPVLNATGVLLHTNIGRAPLSAAAVDALTAAAGTWDVELDLATGGRGRRGRGAIEALLAAVPGAAEAHLVNNGAAALALLALTAASPSLRLGRHDAGQTASDPGPADQPREVVISRGELVEIGDGFRIPDLLMAAGVRLREVGTTNRTHLADYEAAVGDPTAFVLKVHPSNFVVRGFTAGCSVAQLSGLGVPVVVDIGSGLLRPHVALPDEPDAASALDAGAAVVTASADKLLGGPQGGLLLGAPGPGAELVARARRHPLARAMRVDKLTLAAFEATLRGPAPPVQAALAADLEALRERARVLAASLAAAGVDARAVDAEATVGGGGAPGVLLPSAAVALPEPYAAALRAGRPAVLGRVEGGRCLLDLRALPPAADEMLYGAVLACMS